MSYLPCFAEEFEEASEKFRKAAAARGATVEAHEHPLRSAFGQRLAIDVARWGPADAPCALMVISATHGVEGFLGSAAQVAFLSGMPPGSPPRGTAVLLVHGLNPYGFAAWRRVTEGNVDLNRNFVDFSAPLPANDDYGRIAEALCPPALDGEGRAAADARLAAFMQAQGRGRFQEAVTRGQYTHPDGLFYGGREAAWSRRALEGIVRRHLASARRVAVLDIHTGLGEYGTLQIIVDAPGASTAAGWYGNEHLVDTASDKSVSSPLVGSMVSHIPALLPRAEIVGAALEFGTAPAMQMLDGLRADAWLYAHGEGDTARYASIRRNLRDLFYPTDASWRETICGSALDTMIRALAGLRDRRVDESQNLASVQEGR